MSEEKRKAYELSYQRTAHKIEQRRKTQEKWQRFTLVLLMCLMTVYLGK